MFYDNLWIHSVQNEIPIGDLRKDGFTDDNVSVHTLGTASVSTQATAAAQSTTSNRSSTSMAVVPLSAQQNSVDVSEDTGKEDNVEFLQQPQNMIASGSAAQESSNSHEDDMVVIDIGDGDIENGVSVP